MTPSVVTSDRISRQNWYFYIKTDQAGRNLVLWALARLFGVTEVNIRNRTLRGEAKVLN